jgi:hypothetical protein
MSALRDPRVRDPALLELACGLRAMLDRFDDLLARHAPASPGETAAEPDELTTLVLGVIALRDRIEGELARAVAHARPGSARDLSSPWPTEMFR